MQPAPRGVGDRVDDVERRVLGPGRAREVERLDARERLAAALVGLRAQPRVDLLLATALELPVVVEQPHRASAAGRERSTSPRPPMKSSQTREAAARRRPRCSAKTRPMTPSRWSMPAARRTRIHAWSSRLSTTRPPSSSASRIATNADEDRRGRRCRSRYCDLRGDPQRSRRGAGPRSSRLTTTISAEQRVREQPRRRAGAARVAALRAASR